MTLITEQTQEDSLWRLPPEGRGPGAWVPEGSLGPSERGTPGASSDLLISSEVPPPLRGAGALDPAPKGAQATPSAKLLFPPHPSHH